MTQMDWKTLIRAHKITRNPKMDQEIHDHEDHCLSTRGLNATRMASIHDEIIVGSEVRRLIGEIFRLRGLLDKYEAAAKTAEMSVGDLLEASVQIALNREIRKLTTGEAAPICPELAALKGYLDNSDVVYIQSRIDAGTNCIAAERLSALRQAVDFTLQHELQSGVVSK